MTPLDFLDFRDLLMPASGFQSVQFRMIEIRLGLKSEDRLLLERQALRCGTVRGRPRARRAVARRPTLIDQLDRWLERTPFVDAARTIVFHDAYRDAVERDAGS